MKDEAKITISRQSPINGDDVLSIRIIDSQSSLVVVQVVMSAEDFALAISGSGFRPAKYAFCPTIKSSKNYRKKRITEDRFCSKVNTFSKDDQRLEVEAHFLMSGDSEEWKILSDGTGTQQPPDKHRYTIVRYEEA